MFTQVEINIDKYNLSKKNLLAFTASDFFKLRININPKENRNIKSISQIIDNIATSGDCDIIIDGKHYPIITTYKYSRVENNQRAINISILLRHSLYNLIRHLKSNSSKSIIKKAIDSFLPIKIAMREFLEHLETKYLLENCALEVKFLKETLEVLSTIREEVLESVFHPHINNEIIQTFEKMLIENKKYIYASLRFIKRGQFTIYLPDILTCNTDQTITSQYNEKISLFIHILHKKLKAIEISSPTSINSSDLPITDDRLISIRQQNLLKHPGRYNRIDPYDQEGIKKVLLQLANSKLYKTILRSYDPYSISYKTQTITPSHSKTPRKSKKLDTYRGKNRGNNSLDKHRKAF